MTPRALVALAVAVPTLVATGCSRGAEAAPRAAAYKVAYMICNSEDETLERFGPLTAYLARATGVALEPVAVDTVAYVDAVRKGDIAFTHTNSLLYVILKEKLGVELVAGELRGRYGNLTTGALIVKASSPIERLEDLRGKRVAFGPNLAPFGFLAQYDLLERAGIDPEDDLRYYAIPRGSFKHEKVAFGVLDGAYDAGAVPELDLERWQASGLFAEDDFRVLARSAPGPYCTFAATPSAPPALTARFRDALLDATPDAVAPWHGETLRVLDRAWVDGFVEVEDHDYDLLREMARRTRMPPYEAAG